MRIRVGALTILFTVAIPTLLLNGAAQDEKPNPIDAAKMQMQAGEFAEAAQALKTLVDRGTKPDAEVFMLLAACLHNLKADKEAIEVFEEGFDLYPASPDMQDFYVALLRSTSPPEVAKASLTRRYERDPDSLILLRALIYLHLQLEYASPQTAELVNRFLKVAPANPNAHYLYGEWARLNKKDAEAVASWQKCLALASPDENMQLRVHTLIALAEARQSRFAEARAAFERAHKTNQESHIHDPDAAQFYVEFLKEQNLSEEALRVVDQILTWDPAFGPAHFERASRLSRAGRHEAAYQEAHLALDDQRLLPDRQRAVRLLLIRLCSILKLETEAREHESWVKAN